jgi:large-conductance mechanosensitive channel
MNLSSSSKYRPFFERLKTFIVEPGTGIFVMASGMAIGPVFRKLVTDILNDILIPIVKNIIVFSRISKIKLLDKMFSFPKKYSPFIFKNFFIDIINFSLSIITIFIISESLKNKLGVIGLLIGDTETVKDIKKGTS